MNARKKPQLLLCADATAEIGAGHAMRLANLAEVWTAGALPTVHLVGKVSIPFARERLAALGVEILDELPAAPFTGIMVVDSYDARLRASYADPPAPRLRVLVDDLGGEVPMGYNVVWNPNAYGSASLYADFGGEVLTGAGAVPVQSGLPRWSGNDSSTIGVMLGGGAVSDVLARAMVELAAAMPTHRFRAVGEWVPGDWECVAPQRPWDVLAECDVLITAGGSAVWEAAAVGIPVVVLKTAANQDRVCQWVRRHGAPVVDASSAMDPAELVVALRAAAVEPLRLPEIMSGTKRVALALESLAGGAMQTAAGAC